MFRSHHGPVWTALVVVVSLLVVTATPATVELAAAQTADDVASIHTTDTDFGNAAVLDNMTVEGSGASASVVFNDSVIDDFDDGDLSEYQYDGGSNFSVDQSSPVHDGSHSLKVTTNFPRPVVSTSGLTGYPDQGENFSVRYWGNASSDSTAQVIFAAQDQDNFYQILVSEANTDMEIQKATGDYDSPTTLTTSDLSAFPSGEWLEIETRWETDGTITVTVTAANGTVLGTAQTTDTTYSDGGIGFRGRNGVYDTEIETPRPESGQYISANHTAEAVETGWANLTIENASVTVEFQFWNGNEWKVRDSTTVSSTQNLTLDLAGQEQRTKWRVNVTVDPDDGATPSEVAVELHDEGLLFEARPPTVNNSTADPDDERLTSRNVTLSINVSDPDFALAQGDELTVEFFVREPMTSSFVSVGTDTLTSNGTAELDYTADEGGEYEWYANVSDAYGNGPVQSDTFNFSTPENLTLRNESNASEIVTGATVEVTFFTADGTTVVRKTDSDGDGNISLAGLPNTDLVAVIRADGWYDRRVYIRSLFDQQNVYLLNETAHPNAIDTTFIYEDRTGDFPPDETILEIQRAVDVDNDDTFAWATVAGDFWGAAGEFPFTGEDGARYRLVITNTETNEQRVLGTHIPTADGTKNIVVGKLQWPAENATGRVFDAALNVSVDSILVTYRDPTEKTTAVRLQVWERGNRSNEIYDANFTNGPYGTLQVQVTLTSGQAEQSWVVHYTADHDTEGELDGRLPVGSSPFPMPGDPWLVSTVGWIGVTFVATLYGPRTATLGAWTLVVVAGTVMVLQLWAVPTASFLLAILVAGGGTFYQEAIP